MTYLYERFPITTATIADGSSSEASTALTLTMTTTAVSMTGTSVAVSSVRPTVKLTEEQEALEKLVNSVYFYVMGICISLGLVCNTFCIAICLVSVGLRRTTTGHYLVSLAVADWLFLSGDLVRWMNVTTEPNPAVSFMHTSDLACKANYFLRYSAKLISAWITVAIVVERLTTVAFPLKAAFLLTTTKTRLTIAVIALCGCCLGSYPLWTVGVGENSAGRSRCKIIKNAELSYRHWSTAVLRIGTLGLPASVITTCTVAIVVMLSKATRARRLHMEGQSSQQSAALSSRTTSIMSIFRSRQMSNVSQTAIRSNVCRSRGPPQRQLSAMLVGVCAAFVCLRLPNAVAYYAYEYRRYFSSHSSDPGEVALRLQIVYRITDVIATSNYLVNFFLYSVCGSYFRNQVVAACRCRQRMSQGSRTLQRVGTFGSFSSARFRRGGTVNIQGTSTTFSDSSSVCRRTTRDSLHLNQLSSLTPNSLLADVTSRSVSTNVSMQSIAVTPTSQIVQTTSVYSDEGE